MSLPHNTALERTAHLKCLLDLLLSFGLFIRHIDQYVPAAREAMVAVGGRLLYSGVKEKVIEEFVQKSTFDSDRWVRRKAEHAISMLTRKDHT